MCDKNIFNVFFKGILFYNIFTRSHFSRSENITLLHEAEVEMPNIFSDEDSDFEPIQMKWLTTLEHSTYSGNEGN